MGSKPQSETTTNSTSTFTPPPAVLAEYKKVTNQANTVAQTPYQSYDDQLVAPISNETNSGINTINEQNGGQNGYNQGAVQQTILGGRAVTPTAYGQANVNQYLSPYINDVVKATEGQIQNQNQQQSSALTGNAISSGAFGGDRSGVAQAALAGQQDIASNQAIASLYNQGFLNAQGEFNNQQAAKIGAQENTAARRLAQGQQLGALGQLQQQEGLQQGAAQVQAGGLQQATQQAADTAAYNQFLQKQAYPFQTTGWLANIAEGIGSQSGGTSTGSSDSTMYGNGLTGLLGGGLGLFSFLNRGGRVGRQRGGVVPRRASGGGGLGIYMDSGGSPTETALDPAGALGGGSWVVPANLPVGHTMPGSTGAPTTTPSSTTNPLDAQLLSTGASMFKNSSMGDAFSDFTQDTFGFAEGGVVPFRRRRKRFDDGGSVDDALSVGPDGVLTASDISASTGIVPIQTTTGETALAAPHAPPTNDNGAMPNTGYWGPNGYTGDILAVPPPPAPKSTPSEWTSPQSSPDGSNSAYGIVSPLNPPLPPRRPTDDFGTPPEARAALAAAMSGGVAPSAASDNSAFGVLSPLNPPLPPVRPGERDYTDGPALAGALPDTAKLPPSDPAQHKAMIEADAAEWNEEKAAAAARAAAGNAGTGAASGVAPTTPGGVAPDASAFGVDPTFNRMIGIESRGQQFNADGSVKTSSKGALGIAQVMPGTGPEAAGYAGLPWDPKRLTTDPAYNLALGKAYYQHQLETFGTPDKAAAAYNAGPAATAAAIDKAKQTGGSYLQYLPKETQAYVARATTGEVPAVDAISTSSPAKGLGVSQASAPAEHHSQGVLGGLRNLLWGDSGQSGDTMHNPVENAVGNQTTGRSGLLGLNMSDSTRLGLLAAGLGIMGGTSMNPWTNIGQGGLKGLQTAMSAQGLNSEIGLRGAQTANQQAEAIQHMTEAQKSQYMLGNMKKFFEEHDKTQTSNAKAADEGGPPISAPAASPAAPVPTPAPTTGVPAPVAQTGAPLAPAASAAVAPAAATVPAATAPTSSDPWANWRVPPDQDPVRLTQQANTLFAQANRANMAGLDGVARGYLAQAEQLRNKAQTIAGTGDVVYPDGKGGTISGKLPGWVPRQAQVEGSNEAAKSQAAVPAGVGRAMAEKDIEGAHTAAAASQATLYRMKEMDHQIQNLPSTGFLAPGTGAESRAQIAKGVNSVVGAFGGKPIFDPNNVASIEELSKDRFRLGAELSRQIGGREPGYIVEQAVQANPGADNSKAGYQRIVSGLRQSALYANDYAKFVDGYFAQHGTTVGAPEAFQSMPGHRPDDYVERAITSTVDPRDAAALAANIKNPAAAARIDQKYGKGTAGLLAKRGFDTSDGTPQ